MSWQKVSQTTIGFLILGYLAYLMGSTYDSDTTTYDFAIGARPKLPDSEWEKNIGNQEADWQ